MGPGSEPHGNYPDPRKEVHGHIMCLPLRPKNSWMVVLLSGIGWAAGSVSCPKECTCQHLAVNCTGRALEELPTTVPLDTRQLVLAQNKLSYLPFLELHLLSDLIYLDCSGNTLGKDLDSTFASMVKLVYLDLSFNNLTQVTPGTFSQLSSLVVLKLSDNPHLEEIEKDSLANNTWLRHLDVSRCGLMFLDASTVRELPHLRNLGLGGNPWLCNCSFMELCGWLQDSGITILDPANVTCHSPVFMHGLNMLEEAQEDISHKCYLHFSNQEYLFLGLVGFGIFSAGTVLAWLLGVCAVICEFLTARGEEDKEEEETES